jgi:hypothetical protein
VKTATTASGGRSKILLATSVGGHVAGTTLESLLGAALALRGAEIHVLLCDRLLPACLHCDVSWYPNQKVFATHGPRRDLCNHCFEPAAKAYQEIGAVVHKFSDFVSTKERAEANRIARDLPVSAIKNYRLNGLALGEHAIAGVLRFFARASIDNERFGEAITRRYFEAALLTVHAVRRLVAQYGFDVAVFHHGIYVPQGLIGEVCRAEGIRVVNWNPAYRKRTFIFSHEDTYHHTLMSEPIDAWEKMEWSAAHEAEIMRYLATRWHGTEDWIWFHERPIVDVRKHLASAGIDGNRPVIGLLTNVMWDAQLHYPTNAFASMLDWIVETIRYFAGRPDLQLVIRIHPAEIRGTLRSRQPLMTELANAFPRLPSNVVVFPPEDRVSTYALMEKCDTVLIYGTKTGVELASMGIPVVVAGEAWIRNKGITMDAASAPHYFAILDSLPVAKRMNPDTIERARKYAYHFFFRRMIPLESVKPAIGNPPFQVAIRSLRDLLPGESVGLDVICDGILHGTPFIYPADQLAGARLRDSKLQAG